MKEKNALKNIITRLENEIDEANRNKNDEHSWGRSLGLLEALGWVRFEILDADLEPEDYGIDYDVDERYA